MSRISSTLAVERRVAALMGSDTTQYGASTSDANEVRLAQNAFTPGTELTLGDLTEADFGGYSLKATAGQPFVNTDPATQDSIITLNEPAGGWKWNASGTPPANSPQTIYGYYVTTESGLVLLGAQLLDNPVIISASTDTVIIGAIQVRLPVGMLS